MTKKHEKHEKHKKKKLKEVVVPANVPRAGVTVVETHGLYGILCKAHVDLLNAAADYDETRLNDRRAGEVLAARVREVIASLPGEGEGFGNPGV